MESDNILCTHKELDERHVGPMETEKYKQQVSAPGDAQHRTLFSAKTMAPVLNFFKQILLRKAF